MKLGNILKQHWAFTVSETRRKLYFFSVNYDCLQCKLEHKLNEIKRFSLDEMLCVHCLFSHVSGNFDGFYLVQNSASLSSQYTVNFLSIEHHMHNFSFPGK